MIIPIPIPIFVKEKTQEEIRIDGIIQNNKDLVEHNKNLRKDINNFGQKFRDKDIRISPEAYTMFQIFGHKDIEKLNLHELLQLGFGSEHITRGDLE